MDRKDFCNEICPETNLGSMSTEADNKKYPKSSETSGNSLSNFESPTPEKPDWGRKGTVIASLAKNLLTESYKDEKENSIELPDNCKILVDLFNKLDTSIRLLRLRKKTGSLKNISAQVEVLAKRKLLPRHVAQMKYLMPDAVKIEKILSHDEDSLLMYPDLKITLTTDFLKPFNADQSPSMALCKAFNTSILKFVSLHPKDTEIPEAILPEPFNSIGKNSDLKRISNVLSPQPPTILTEEALSNSSHLPSSFRKSTFQNLNEHAGTARAAEPIPPQPEVKRDFTEVLSPLPVDKAAGVMTASTPNREGKLANAALTDTPVQRTPQRPFPTPSDKCITDKDDSKSGVTRSARKLNFQKESEGGGAISDSVVAISSLVNNEGCASKNETVTSIGEKRLASLPFTFDAICLISQSKDCSLITKKELVHKILSNNLEVEETSEIEEHLATLEELYPEWICKKCVSDGEVFYSVKHASDSKAIRARLVTAI